MAHVFHTETVSAPGALRGAHLARPCPWTFRVSVSGRIVATCANLADAEIAAQLAYGTSPDVLPTIYAERDDTADTPETPAQRRPQ